ncbi:hypothetical protein BGZ97_010754 [Linnemannia gamsii]|uniref:Aminoacyl-transfer RNA synthetases class-II family profile domain-containing protein n=1 Tax=Linnemannia gamsii TaxID=64522 RepID=A0A9P6R7T9_9FUNG|nr:hypothetical protein BGZ97_010754 [Linnemannia gamsii]
MSAMRHLLDLCKRRGFLFQSAEIHGGLRGAYDYGPLGVELKRNVSQEWWNSMVYQRSDVVGIDTAIITPPAVLKTSGHVDQFTDEMVDSRLSKERFRPDKAPALKLVDQDKVLPISAPDKVTAKVWEQDIRTQFAKGALITRKGKEILLQVERMEKDKIVLKRDNTSTTSEPTDLHIPYHGYVDPNSNSPFLTTSTRQLVDKTLHPSLTYLRPETAQGVFINYATVQRSHPHLKIPFGIAQIGKSFRNEIRLEHAIFRTPEFEQMELEFFVAPWQAEEQFESWRKFRMDWWKYYGRNHDRIRERPHAQDELAHYSSGCVDVEYLFPWGWGEVEGIANRGDFDLSKHSEATGIKLQYTDAILMQERQVREKATGVKETSVEVLAKERFTPHVVESSCGLNRAMLALMLDAMEVVDEQGKAIPFPGEGDNNNDANDTSIVSKGVRTIMKLHPRLAPVKVGIMPLISNNKDLVELCTGISQSLRQELQVNVSLETQSTTIGKRYYRMDEIGTPWCVTVDFESLQDRMVTIRERDTGEQRRVSAEEVVEIVRDGLRLHPRGSSSTSNQQ